MTNHSNVKSSSFLKNIFFTLIGLLISANVFGQLNPQEKFSTFGIIAMDSVEKTWGCAIATNNIGIGQYGVFEIKPDVGIIASIAFTDPRYPIQGLKMLESGLSLQAVFDSLKSDDSFPQLRQIAMIVNKGTTFSYIGNVFESYAISGSIEGKNYIVFGNSFLNENVLKSMSFSFEQSEGKLCKRLSTALIEGQQSGGQASGKMSAALLVKKSGQTGFNEADIRIDYSVDPFEDLKKLVNKKEGLEMFKKAKSQSNPDSALFYFNKSAILVDGWTMMYSELAREFYLLKRPDLSINILKKGMEKDPLFKNSLPDNYFLIDNLEYKRKIKSMNFQAHDWLNAIYSLVETKEYLKAEKLGKRLLDQYPNSSHLYLLIGNSLEGQKKPEESGTFYRKAYELNKNNVEAEQKVKNSP